MAGRGFVGKVRVQSISWRREPYDKTRTARRHAGFVYTNPVCCSAVVTAGPHEPKWTRERLEREIGGKFKEHH